MSPLPILLLALPILEIAVFIVVGGWIGVLPTLGLTVLATITGAVLLRIQGFGAVQRIRRDVEARRDPGREVAHGAMIMLAGILLLLPGFITDVVGLALFIPAIRDVAWRFLRPRIGTVSMFSFGFPAAGGRTIDLDAEDYARRPEPHASRPRLDDDGQGR
ncbi:MAG: FxsA family protein [Rhizobiaceae bacterium]|nr:FxsA family protein [Rhizobiaceae bacterium]